MSEPLAFFVAGFSLGVVVLSRVVDWAHARGRGFDVAECRHNVFNHTQPGGDA